MVQKRNGKLVLRFVLNSPGYDSPLLYCIYCWNIPLDSLKNAPSKVGVPMLISKQGGTFEFVVFNNTHVQFLKGGQAGRWALEQNHLCSMELNVCTLRGY